MLKRVYEPSSSGGRLALSAHVFLMRGEQVLLTRRGPDVPYAPGLWHAGVAGKVEQGEDIVTAAVRESDEELGIGVAAADLEFGHVVHSQESQREWVHVFFVCREWSGTPVNREPHKHTEIGWWPAHQLPPGTVDYCAWALRHLLVGQAFSQHHTATAYPTERTVAEAAPVAEPGDASSPASLDRVLSDIARERRRQQDVYGVRRLASCTDEDLYAELIRAGAVLVRWAQIIEDRGVHPAADGSD